MRRLCLVIFVGALVAACASSPPPKRQASSSAAVNECKEFGILGAVMMTARQTGKPKAEALAVLDKQKPSPLNDVAYSLLEAAYQSPIASTKEGQQKMVSDFAVETARICLSAREKAGLK